MLNPQKPALINFTSPRDEQYDGALSRIPTFIYDEHFYILIDFFWSPKSIVANFIRIKID